MGHQVDSSGLPPNFPTLLAEPEFWEHLGRAVATFGFLEDVLKRAWFAVTGTQVVDEMDAQSALDKWGEDLAKNLVDPLGPAIEKLAKALNENQKFTKCSYDGLIKDLKEAAVIRNLLCHSCWDTAPDENGAIIPHFVTKKGKWCIPVNKNYLVQVQKSVGEMACNVINIVTIAGWQFPGSAGPGKEIS